MPTFDQNPKIDIVIPWVDGNDKQWLSKKNQYLPENEILNTEARYRDFGILKYALRSIEQNLPWIHKIYLLTDHQIPSFIDINKTDKLVIIDHTEFIPSQYLPTFNSNVIELNIKNIKELSEYFILINDDVLFNQPMKKTDFFKNGQPVDACIFSPTFPKSISIARNLANNLTIINDNFSKRKMVKENFSKVYTLKYGKRILKNITLAPYSNFCGFYDHHVAIPYRKSTFRFVLENQAKDYYERTCLNKFRSELDITQWLIRYWQFASGSFYPRTDKSSQYLLMKDLDAIKKGLSNKKVKQLCINDTNETSDYEYQSTCIVEWLEKKFSTPASFEIKESEK